MNRLEELIVELCPNGVEYITLNDICSVYDGTHQTPEYTDSGIRFVSVENINALYDTNKYISVEAFENYKIKPQKNDILMTRIGSIGTCAVVDRDEPLAYYVSLALLRPDFSKINSYYLKYVIESKQGRKELRKRTLVNAVPIKVNMGDIGKIIIPVPPMKVQEEIVKVLNAYNEPTKEIISELSIELEGREKQYKYYRDKLLDYDDETPVFQIKEVASYVKDRIDASELNENTYVGVDNLLQNRKGKTFTSHLPTEGRFINYKESDILIGNIRPYLKKIWFADNNGGTNGDVLVLRTINNHILPEYLFVALCSDRFFDYNMKYAKGTKMPRGDKDAILKYTIPVPSLDKQQQIITMVKRLDVLFEKIIELISQEIEDRQKQYEYYRDQLLSFKQLSE